MIYYSNLQRFGRFGNQLWQVASCIGLAEKYGTKAVIPHWNYAKYFSLDIEQADIKPEATVNEPHFHYAGEFFDSHAQQLRDKVVDISGDGNTTGYLQSYKYFEHCKEKIISNFTFHPSFKENIVDRYKDVLSRPTIGISIRIGEDYIKNGNYVILPITYYLGALFTNFPNWRDYNIIIFTDNPDYCKLHFGCLSNVYYTDTLIDIEQLCLATLCDNLIIPNSTFGWWAAYLSKAKTIIRPDEYFAGDLFRLNSIKDFWYPSWLPFYHTDYRIDLTDVTFTIPVHYDHKHRQENLDLSVAVLQQTFDTNIIIGEQGSDQFEYHSPFSTYMAFGTPLFHRTKMLNEMAAVATTPIVVNWDADILIPPLQILEAVQMIRDGEADMVYPYDGRFARVPRIPWLQQMLNFLDVGMFGKSHFSGMGKESFISVGGAIVVNKEKFFESGGENEHFISYGPEDQCRFHRWKKLGYAVKRVKGVLYHLDHFLSINSSSKHEHFNGNNIEYGKIKKMNPEQLRAYVNSWKQTKQSSTEGVFHNSPNQN